VTELAIAKDLWLPVDAVTQKLAFLGRTGSGKTYGATKLAELMLSAGAQIVALDPVGVWYGLRLAGNGAEPSELKLPVFGGLHGDIPIEPTSGALLADLVVDRGISAILDVSQLESDRDKARFAGDFANRFFFRKKAAPSAVHLFVEECQEFVPQNPAKGEEQMLHHFHRLIKLGRNFGIGVSLISQRPQEVNKKALNQTELMLAFQMTGPQERKAISLWVSEKGADEDVGDILPKLKVGEAHVWSPQWLQISRTVKIAAKRTFNASSTPTVGGKAVEARPLGEIDLEKLQKAMASTIEKAKAEDPRALRAEVARLKRELEAKPKTNGHSAKPVDREQIQRLVDVGVRKATETLERDQRQFRQGLKREIDRLQRQFEPIGTTVAALSSAVAAEFKPIDKATPGALLAPVEHRLNPSSPVTSLSGSTPERRAGGHAGRDSRERPAPRSAGSGASLGKGEWTVLIAIAQYPEGAERDQLTVLTGYKRSTRDTYIQRLSLAGHVAIEGGRVLATDAGIDALGSDFEPLPQGEELQEHWLYRLPEGERAILKPLIAAYPLSLDRDSLSEATGYKRSTRDTYIQRLKSRRLLEDVGRGEVRASGNLFS
jgi:hypothetical protein